MKVSMLSAQRAAVALAVLAGCHGAQAATWTVWGSGLYEPARQVTLTPSGVQMFTTLPQDGRPGQAQVITTMGMGSETSLGSPPGLIRSTAWGIGRDGAYAMGEQLADGSTQFVVRRRTNVAFKTVFSTLLQVPTLGLEQPGVILDRSNLAVSTDTGLLVRRPAVTQEYEDVRVNLAPGLKPIAMAAPGKTLVADGLRSLAWVNTNKVNPVVTPLSVPSSALQVEARAANDRGQVVGCMVGRTDRLSKAYLTGDNGLGFKTIEVPSAVESCALGVNRHGQVVGVAYPTRAIPDVPRQSFAFVTDPEGRNPRALNSDAGDANSALSLSSLTHAYGIDLQGRVVAGDASAKLLMALAPQATCSVVVEIQPVASGGLTGKLTLTNLGRTAVSGWKAGWTYLVSGTGTPWPARIVSHTEVKGGVMGAEGSNVTVAPSWFSGSIKPGASATVTFKADINSSENPWIVNAFALLGPNNCKVETRVLPLP